MALVSKPFGDAPDFVDSDDDLATKERGSGQRCQVCDFPAVAGHVQGVIKGEDYELQLCTGCFKYTILVLRAQYKQKRLFDDDFDFCELEEFGRLSSSNEVGQVLDDREAAGRAERSEDLGIEKMTEPPRRIIRLKEVMHLSGLGRSSIYNYIAAGRFPKSHRLGGGIVGWNSSEVQRWIDAMLDDQDWKPSDADSQR